MPQSFRDVILALHTLPNWAIFAIVFSVLLGAVSLGPIVSHRVFGLKPSDKRSQGALDAYKSVTTYAALMISFSLVQVVGNLRSVEEQINREAAAFNNMDRVLARFGAAEMASLRPALDAYGRAIVDQEWPLLARAQRSPVATEAFRALSRGAHEIEPANHRQEALYNEMLRVMHDLTDLRENRLANTELSLPGPYWATVFAVCGILVVLASLVTPAPERTVQIRGMMAVLSLLLSLVVVVDSPFSGEYSASPRPIERVLAFNRARS